jgi:hypothetical protein
MIEPLKSAGHVEGGSHRKGRPGRGEPIGPLDWLRLLPHAAAASSDRLGWVGLEAARCRATLAFELNVPVLTHHQLFLFACPPEEGPNTYRRVGRWTEEAVLERMEARLAARPAILKQRREIAEHPFGSIKQWMNQGTFLLRGRAGEGTGRIQPDGAGLQFHPRSEHRGRREPPQSGVKEGGRLPPVTSHPRGAGDLSCGARKWRPLSEI